MLSRNATHRLWLPLFFLILALIAFLAIGARKLQRDYQIRGIEPGLPPPIAHSGVQVGFNVALEQYEPDALDDVLDQIEATGVQAIKQTFYFTESFDWNESDRIISAVSRHPLQLTVLLDGDPAQDFAPPADPATFASWAGEFASRYGDHIRYYIVWDEPNLSSHWGNGRVNPADYAALLSATAARIRAEDAGAVIVAAPLAPTTERGPENLADSLYLSGLYEAGAADVFDVAAGKPYGFHSGPDDREVDLETLNFSRIILLREVMRRYGDEQTALFAGNWGWNSLPEDWQGTPSIWGQTDAQTQARYTVEALERVRREWPWMGLMFLEHWEPAAPADDPRQGFTIRQRPIEQAIQRYRPQNNVAYPGFHLAQADGPGQAYEGGWRFSSEYGADISETGDSFSVRFWGTDAGLRVRRANYRARFYVYVDGEEANALPNDGDGTALVLTAPVEGEDFLSTELVVEGLPPGEHTLTVVAYRGWDQWALNGFSIAYRPPARDYLLSQVALALLGAVCLSLAYYTGRRVAWGTSGRAVEGFYNQLSEKARIALMLLAAILVTITGFLTWGEHGASIYRRLGDISQLALTAAAASIFYVTPFFFLYLLSLLALFFLVYARPAWGLALVAFSFPFYVVPKPMMGYRFSPVEIFTLVVTAATLTAHLSDFVVCVRQEVRTQHVRLREASWQELKRRASSLRAHMVKADVAVLAFVAVATASLFVAEQLNVAENEWRVVIIEPALFYFLVRAIRPNRQEMWAILDAFVLGGFAVTLYGLVTYSLGQNTITVDGGLSRLRAHYGSPNNVALYLGRILPFLLAMTLLGKETPRRRLAYGAMLLPMGLAILLTFSKGGLFLGVPAAVVTVLILWRRGQNRAVWPWLLTGAVLALIGLVVALNHPLLAQRLDLQGKTSVVRVSLWYASLNMFAEHPFLGVGLDNFLYAYRGRYMLDAAWAEPYLNHPHNIVLDFATRLGLFGLVTGAWLIWQLIRRIWLLLKRENRAWLPVVVGLAGAAMQMLAHGIVDHSFFLADLAYAFFLTLGLSVWLESPKSVT